MSKTDQRFSKVNCSPITCTKKVENNIFNVVSKVNFSAKTLKITQFLRGSETALDFPLPIVVLSGYF